jgi:hypothetical protein
MNTTSQPPTIPSSRVRTASRMSLRARTRFTAPPTRRLAATPTRTRPTSLANTPRTNQRLTQERPNVRTRSKSLLRRNRLARGIPTSALGVPIHLFDVARRYRQAVASFSAPGLEYLPPIAGLHARPKTVHPRAPSLFRLISPFGGHIVQNPPAR